MSAKTKYIIIATHNAHKVQEIRAILGDAHHYFSLQDFTNSPQVVEDALTFAENAKKKAAALADWLAGGRLRPSMSGIQGKNSPSGSSALEGLSPNQTKLDSPDASGSASGGGEAFPEGADPARCYVLADDSGLEVDFLHGAPGVYSARFAAGDSEKPGNCGDAANNAELLRLLANVPPAKRTGRFRCVTAFTPVNPFGVQGEFRPSWPSASDRPIELFEGECEGVIGTAPRGQGGFGYDPLFTPNGYSLTFAELGERVKNQISHRAQALLKLRHHLEPA
jgi:non-canonical purine NTP pyrophosphatase (RdgB/HAM1 family)